MPSIATQATMRNPKKMSANVQIVSIAIFNGIDD